ncbi:PASTA domain-containing protein [Sedimentibacter sp. zth1]|uniref:penicillin-binding transpeptidase domain-containing protein n=1 Tax=Sedimentibacter sp. zth1 TaxID=2816908 RepID=UPI001A919618|nr:penicillin-binding transpeptidase domain-containing protein [Sedimentibacter sp. zth1]QSX06147.1 PASTA domain-containing protein [Sedimentibacter sp. zth1]
MKFKNDGTANLQNKRRMLVFLLVFFAITLALIAKLGYIQLVKGNEYKKGAYEQWSKDVVINAKRGTIYDSKGKKLAVSVNANTVVCYPQDVRKGSSDRLTIEEETNDDEGNFITNFFNNLNKKITKGKQEELLQAQLEDLKSLDEIAQTLSEILEMDKDAVYKKITEKSKYNLLKKWITKEQVEKIREANIIGISIIDDNKRVYPYGNFAPYILGFTDIDQHGLYGVEATFDSYLTGVPGRVVVNTDGKGRDLPYGYNEYFESEDGYGIVLTIDETIQHFADKAAEEALANTQSKRVNIVLMEPETGDIIAMASKPDYDPNNPKENINPEIQKQWDNLPQDELIQNWYDMWRNSIVNDIYEPGSTFKPLVVAIALQENKTSPERTYFCDGYARQIKSANIKCWRYYNPHGQQTLAEVLQHSCNDAMVEIGLDIGAETFYNYLRALGFGEKSGIMLNGEEIGIVNHYKYMKDVNVATQSFGQGVSVTPLQLVTAISCLANDGNLMEPRIVKQLIDSEGNIIKNYEPVMRRNVFTEEVANMVIDMMGTVVEKGGAKAAAISGYRVGGKTGTAQKAIPGGYAPAGTYISSFVGVAPTDDPKVVCLMTLDEPQGTYYGSIIAAPVVGQLIEETLKYMEIEPKYSEQEIGAMKAASIEVPDVTNMTIAEASKTLQKLKLQHNVTIDVEEDAIVKDQFPQPGTKVTKNSIITLILN